MPRPTIVFAGPARAREVYAGHLTAAIAEQGLDVALAMDPASVAPAATDYLLYAPNGPIRDLRPYAGLRALLSLWAGVEVLLALDPPDVPIVRMVDPGMTMGMTDYVVGHVLRHHLDIDRHLGAAPFTDWDISPPPLASERPVGVLGLGALGAACGTALTGLGFPVLGWARGPKNLPGIDCRHGPDGLTAVLARAQILVLLLPLTPQTTRLIDADRLARMPRGTCLINAARGPLIDHGALLSALDTGHLRHATMDVFDVEPLPADHPYWRHPRVTVTPHIASATRPATAARAMMAQIAADLAGRPLTGVVDRVRGY